MSPEPSVPVDEATAGAEEAASDGELKGRALSATLVTIVGHFGGNGVRLASNLILTRLLLPEHFGIMALVNVALIGLHMFSDVGIGPNVIQHEHGEDRAFLHTAFTVQTARGVWLLIAGCLLAWPIAHFYEIPDLVWMIPIAATTALTDGFTSTKVFRENRRLRLGRVTAIEVAAQVSTAVTMIVIALITRSIIALLVGSIAGSLVRVVLSHTMLPGFRDGFAWDPEARKALLTFGRWIFVSTAITFISMQVDRLVLGKLVDIELLGVYSIAVTLAAVPREVLGQLAQRVLYPVVAQVVRGKGAREKLRAIGRTTLAILIVPSGFLAGEGVAVFNVLYDDRYAAGGPMMMILCIGTWLTLVQMTYGVVVLAMARPKWISFGTALKSVVFLALSWPVFHSFGVLGVTVLIAVSEIAVYLMVGLGVRKEKVTSWLFDAVATVGVLVVGAVTYWAQTFITRQTGTDWVGLIALGLLVLGVTGFAAHRAGFLRRGQREPAAA